MCHLMTFQGAAIFEAWKEQLHRAYLFWTPTSTLSLSGQVVYDTFEAPKTGLLTNFSDSHRA